MPGTAESPSCIELCSRAIGCIQLVQQTWSLGSETVPHQPPMEAHQPGEVPAALEPQSWPEPHGLSPARAFALWDRFQPFCHSCTAFKDSRLTRPCLFLARWKSLLCFIARKTAHEAVPYIPSQGCSFYPVLDSLSWIASVACQATTQRSAETSTGILCHMV